VPPGVELDPLHEGLQEGARLLHRAAGRDPPDLRRQREGGAGGFSGLASAPIFAAGR
jgi:hypothetical protein